MLPEMVDKNKVHDDTKQTNDNEEAIEEKKSVRKSRAKSKLCTTKTKGILKATCISNIITVRPYDLTNYLYF